MVMVYTLWINCFTLEFLGLRICFLSSSDQFSAQGHSDHSFPSYLKTYKPLTLQSEVSSYLSSYRRQLSLRPRVIGIRFVWGLGVLAYMQMLLNQCKNFGSALVRPMDSNETSLQRAAPRREMEIDEGKQKRKKTAEPYGSFNRFHFRIQTTRIQRTIGNKNSNTSKSSKNVSLCCQRYCSRRVSSRRHKFDWADLFLSQSFQSAGLDLLLTDLHKTITTVIKRDMQEVMTRHFCHVVSAGTETRQEPGLFWIQFSKQNDPFFVFQALRDLPTRI